MLNSVYIAAYLAVTLHFARRMASRIIPGTSRLYFVAIRPNLPGTDLGNSPVILNFNTLSFRPEGTGEVTQGNLWDIMTMDSDELSDYAADMKLDSVVPIQQAVQMVRTGKYPSNITSGIESLYKTINPKYSSNVYSMLLSAIRSKRNRRRAKCPRTPAG